MEVVVAVVAVVAGPEGYVRPVAPLYVFAGGVMPQAEDSHNPQCSAAKTNPI